VQRNNRGAERLRGHLVRAGFKPAYEDADPLNLNRVMPAEGGMQNLITTNRDILGILFDVSTSAPGPQTGGG
jgi:hypothetical protein